MTNVITGKFPSGRLRNMKVAQYMRDVEATRDLPDEQKFAEFIQLCDDAGSGRFDMVLVAFPQILGDDYEELVRNLSRAAAAGLPVMIARSGSK